MSSALRILAAASASLAVASTAGAAPVAATQNASGQASILSSLSVLKQSDLDFGELVVTAAGTAVIDPVSGSTSATGGVTPVGTAGHPAVFIATGSKNSVVHIKLPLTPVTLTQSGGAATVTVSNWTLNGSTNQKIPLSSTFSFAVGGTLNVAAGQPDGIYSGTFQVTVQYP